MSLGFRCPIEDPNRPSSSHRPFQLIGAVLGLTAQARSGVCSTSSQNVEAGSGPNDTGSQNLIEEQRSVEMALVTLASAAPHNRLPFPWPKPSCYPGHLAKVFL